RPRRSTSTGAPRARRPARRRRRTRAATKGEPSSKLPEEAQVVVPEVAQVREAVAQHRDPLEAPAERESGHLLRVVAHPAEHVRVDHARAADLDPAGPAARRAALAVAQKTRHE